MILGYIVAIIALILIIMRAFNLSGESFPSLFIVIKSFFIGIILSLIGVFLKNRVPRQLVYYSVQEDD